MEAVGSRQDMEALARLWIVHTSPQVGSALAILVSRSVFSNAQSDHSTGRTCIGLQKWSYHCSSMALLMLFLNSELRFVTLHHAMMAWQVLAVLAKATELGLSSGLE